MGFLPALAYALLMGALPLVEVLARGRPPAVLVLLFWFETALLLVTGAVRIVVHRRATGKAGHHADAATVSDHSAGVDATRRRLGDANAFLRSFLGVNGVFTLAHGAFAALLVFVFEMAGPVSWQDARLALVYAAGVQAACLLWDLPHVPGWSFARLSTVIGQASLRMLVTQVGLVIGIPAAAIAGSGWGLVGTFVGLRALADASMAWVGGLVRQRDLPKGLAALLSRTSGQSPAALEAEFDALKSDGRAVEALLEQPIDRVTGTDGPRG
jgi:hypothetical protein